MRTAAVVLAVLLVVWAAIWIGLGLYTPCAIIAGTYPAGSTAWAALTIVALIFLGISAAAYGAYYASAVFREGPATVRVATLADLARASGECGLSARPAAPLPRACAPAWATGA